ncbi:MAG: trehalose-phosphatase [Candidatus Omnitrophica bacterium]|nr:trehalose-phosphatase [Candidatus Omnitrophota bacterium]
MMPQDFRRAQAEICRKLAGRQVMLGVDYDGTLAPFAARPEQARLAPAVRRVLRQCAALPRVRLAVVSGRPLADLRRRVAIPDISYAGDHGWCIQTPQGAYTRKLSPAIAQALVAVERCLRRVCADIPGVLIEGKLFSVALHYRAVAAQRRRTVRSCFQHCIRPWREQGMLETLEGALVREARPARPWNKGHAVRWLWRQSGIPPRERVAVYIGDDRTDEDVFRILRESDVGIVVGRQKRSGAQYCVETQAEVIEVLRMFARETMRR